MLALFSPPNCMRMLYLLILFPQESLDQEHGSPGPHSLASCPAQDTRLQAGKDSTLDPARAVDFTLNMYLWPSRVSAERATGKGEGPREGWPQDLTRHSVQIQDVTPKAINGQMVAMGVSDGQAVLGPRASD